MVDLGEVLREILTPVIHLILKLNVKMFAEKQKKKELLMDLLEV